MKITTFEEFQNKFNTALNTATNKINLIDNEIKEIDFLIKTIPIKQKRFVYIFEPKHNNIFNFKLSYNERFMFISSYNNYLFYGKSEIERLPNESEESYSKNVTLSKRGCEFAKYYNWLTELKTQLSSKSQQKKPQLSHKEKMLALHYLGLDLSKLENTNTAQILSQIIDFGADNTRIYLSYVGAGKNEVRTEKNLEKMAKLFEFHNLTDISNKIKKDLENIKK